MKRREKLAALLVGAAGYPLVEMAWRGRTHWSMALAGALSVRAVYAINLRRRTPLALRCLHGAAAITAIELAFGLLFNRLLKRGVWDYSRQRGNLWGQICPQYCGLWFLLCFPLSGLCAGMRRLLGRERGLQFSGKRVS